MIWHVSPLREYRGHGPLKNIPVYGPPSFHCAQTSNRNALPPLFSFFGLFVCFSIRLEYLFIYQSIIFENRKEGRENVIVIGHGDI